MIDILLQTKRQVISGGLLRCCEAKDQQRAELLRTFITNFMQSSDKIIVALVTSPPSDRDEHAKVITGFIRNHLMGSKQDDPMTATCRVLCLGAVIAKQQYCTPETIQSFLDQLRQCSPLIIHHTGLPQTCSLYNRIFTNICQFCHSLLAEDDRETKDLCLQVQQLLWKYAINHSLDQGSPLSRQISIDTLAFMYGILSSQENSNSQEWLLLLKDMIMSLAQNVFQNDEPQECDDIIWNESVRPLLSRFTPHIPCENGELYNMVNSWRQDMEITEENGSLNDDWVCRCAIMPSEMVRSLSVQFTEKDFEKVIQFCASRLGELIGQELAAGLISAYTITLGHYAKYRPINASAANVVLSTIMNSNIRKLPIRTITCCIDTASLAVSYASCDDSFLAKLLDFLYKELWNICEGSTAIRIALIELIRKLPITADLLKRNTSILSTLNSLISVTLQTPSESEGVLGWLRYQKAISMAVSLSQGLFPEKFIKFPTEARTDLQNFAQGTWPATNQSLATSKEASIEIFCQKRKRQFDAFIQDQRKKIRTVGDEEKEGNLQRVAQVKSLLQQMQQSVSKEDPNTIREMTVVLKQAMQIGESIMATLTKRR
jgi:hypothetical protein